MKTMNTSKRLLSVVFAGVALLSAQLSASDSFSNDYSAYSAPINTTPGFDLVEDDDPSAYLDEVDRAIAEANFQIQYEALLEKYEADLVVYTTSSNAPVCTKAVDTLWEAFNDFMMTAPGVGGMYKLIGAAGKTLNNVNCKKGESNTPIPTMQEIYDIATKAAGAAVDEELIKDINSEFVQASNLFVVGLENYQNIERDIEVNGMTPDLRRQLFDNLGELRSYYTKMTYLEARIENRSFNASEVAMLVGGMKIGMLKTILSIQEKHQAIDHNSITEQQYLNAVKGSQNIASALIENFNDYLDTIRSENEEKHPLVFIVSTGFYTVSWIDRNSKTIYRDYRECRRSAQYYEYLCSRTSPFDDMIAKGSVWLKNHKQKLNDNLFNKEFNLYLMLLKNTISQDYQVISSGVMGKCLAVNLSNDAVYTDCQTVNDKFLWTPIVGENILVKNKFSDQCLTITGINNGDSVVLSQCNPSDENQHWEIGEDDTLKPIKANHRCLDAELPNGREGVETAPIILWGCHYGPNQQWPFFLSN